MVLGLLFLRDDLDPAPALSVVLRGVWVLVDPDLLDGGGRHEHAVGLRPVHDEGDAVGADCSLVEKRREGSDDVLIEDGQAVQQLPIHGGSIAILAGMGREPAISDRHFLRDRSDLEGDAEGGARTPSDGGAHPGGFEPVESHLHLILAGGDLLEEETTVGVGLQGADHGVCMGQSNARPGHHRAAWVDDNPTHSTLQGLPEDDATRKRQKGGERSREASCPCPEPRPGAQRQTKRPQTATPSHHKPPRRRGIIATILRARASGGESGSIPRFDFPWSRS